VSSPSIPSSLLSYGVSLCLPYGFDCLFMLAIDLPLPRIAAAESRCARHLDGTATCDLCIFTADFVCTIIGLVLSSRAILLKSPVPMLALQQQTGELFYLLVECGIVSVCSYSGRHFILPLYRNVRRFIHPSYRFTHFCLYHSTFNMQVHFIYFLFQKYLKHLTLVHGWKEYVLTLPRLFQEL
jgi:hypothetical protein